MIHFHFLCIFIVLSIFGDRVHSTCHDGWLEYRTNCYRYLNTSLPFKEANDLCEKTANSSLLTIDSSDEKDFIFNATRHLIQDLFWIRGTSINDCQVFSSYDGSVDITTDVSCYNKFNTICKKSLYPISKLESMLVAVESSEDVVVARPDADMSYLKEALNQTIKMIAQFGRELTDVNKDVDVFVNNTQKWIAEMRNDSQHSMKAMKQKMERFCENEYVKTRSLKNLNSKVQFVKQYFESFANRQYPSNCTSSQQKICDPALWLNCSDVFFDGFYEIKKVFSIPLTRQLHFYDGRNECNRRNATMVTLKSFEESDFLLDWFNSITDPWLRTRSFWIDLRRDYKSHWKWWSDTTRPGYINWAHGEPKDESCVKLDPIKRQWFAWSCETAVGRVVCQRIIA